MYRTTEIAALIKKELDGNISSDEYLRLQAWADDNSVYREFLDQILQGNMVWEDALKWMELENSDQITWEEELQRTTFAKIAASTPSNKHPFGRILTSLIPYAAAILLVAVMGGVYYFTSKKTSIEKPEIVYTIDPGSNRAQLTLEDGHVIELSSKMDGIIVGDKLTYNDGTAIPLDKRKKISMATLTTPTGGMYQVTLPDGTKVWLNAASTLRYPTRFAPDQRVVELEGEAYFDVSKSLVPFLVKTTEQEIEVLGTEFNVMAYADDSSTKTTLVEGSVNVQSNEKKIKLTPGEQGIVQKSGLSKIKVDVNQHIGWKSNKFIFNETELKVAMKELSRWYNLAISYEGEVPITHFYGEISRESKLADVLKTLEVGGVKFRMEKVGDVNRLVVFP